MSYRIGLRAPRYAIFQPPIEEVTREHNGLVYVYANLVAIYAIKCWKNGVSVKIRYDDNASNYYMVSVDSIRVYQDPDTQTLDQPQFVGKKWLSGYVHDGFNVTEANKPAPCRNWNEFKETTPLVTNDSGDFQMHSEPNVYGWALCEDDDVIIGPDIDREVEMDDSEALAWWQKVLLDLGYLSGEL